jgi:hypothetical protein
VRAHLCALFGLLTTLGCNDEIKDTEQRAFSIECKKGKCQLVQDTPPATLAVRTSGRLLVACPEDGSQPIECRALTCDGNSVCQELSGDYASCRGGLCQLDRRPITSDDRLALCLAGTGPWSGSPEQRSRVALALGCRPPCDVPAQCRQVPSGQPDAAAQPTHSAAD